MSFGFEEKKARLPYVETEKITFGVVSEFPKWKYHEKYPQGVIVNDVEEEAALGDDWVNSPAEYGVETHPSVDQSDPVQKRLAELRAARKATE